MKFTLRDFFTSDRAARYQKNVLCFAAGASLVPFITLAQMEATERSSERTLPDETPLNLSSSLLKENNVLKSQMDNIRGQFEAGQPKPNQGPKVMATPVATQGVSAVVNPGADLATPETHQRPAVGAPLSDRNTSDASSFKNQIAAPQTDLKNPEAKSSSKSQQTFAPGAHPVAPRRKFASPLQVFAVSQPMTPSVPDGMSVLPIGAHVKARIVSGVEANAREPYPVLLQLDYAFTGPNKSRINLSNCFMIAKAKANMSTERVMMETESLSCVREDGEHFKREAKGYVAGSDNTFGATGTYISKQGQVLLAAVLASIAKNAGSAIADAQKTSSVVGADKAASATNITGSKAAFIGGSALVDGGAMVAQWYLEQAKELLPSIGVGSGQDVFVIMLDTVPVPTLEASDGD